MKLHQIGKRQQAKARRALQLAMGDVEVEGLNTRKDFYVNRRGMLVILAGRLGADQEIRVSYSPSWPVLRRAA